jgi:rubrerythrin
MSYLLKCTTKRGAACYVAPPGSPKSYVTKAKARVYSTRADEDEDEGDVPEAQGPEGNGYDLPTCRACGYPGTDDHEDCPNCLVVDAP